ncbi:luciferin 4-monooxygenase [Microdochium trichocladiopsis]|uniref:Luciferin 4-monooxygenase n=1 Tax=Microdochium trichocladiopsis TaxID=1682393 RepID=A0A9P8Y7Z2_9PEZI|nr:luciferin 4-monooxygenase [Microdochium trichocladiopsis]KAH7029841.1 luciferin 4-monooxygenase [Microdochium trichocladiopsis]
MGNQRIYRSPYPTPHVPTDLSIPQFLLQSNPDDVPADKVVLEDFDEHGKSITYGQLRNQAALQASALKQQYDLKEGDVVGLFGSPLQPPGFTSRDNRTIPAGIIFSSGTSGAPKAVLLSHHSLIAKLLVLRATNPFNHNAYTREVFFPSFAHIYGIVSGVLLPAWTGGYVVAMPRFEFDGYVRRCADIRATLLRLVPATAARLAADPVVRGLALGTVRSVMCSGASLPAETIAGMRKVLHPEIVVLNGYGMSEGTISLQREGQAHKAGSIGRPAAGAEIRIVGDDGSDVAPGSDNDGECYVRSPTLFMGYKDNAGETADTLDQDGWLHTGDVVKIDRDGDMWLTGRKKELIKYKGNQVAPAELEGILLEHELVVDAGVCGLIKNGVELPAACVVLAGHEATADKEAVLRKLQAHLHERVAPYKRLRGGIFAVQELPRGSTGKLLRRSLPKVIARLGRARPRL